MKDLVGSIVGGCRVEKKLGQGGMGAVFKGIQLSLGREVALKVIAENYMSNEQAVSRFEREARSVGQLTHANIVQVYDLGKTEEGQYYIMMEFVDGRSLSDLMKEKGAIPEAESLQIIRQAAKGLQGAFEKKIIHRDIKPDNLMITRKGVVKVADFGLAKDVSSASQLTATGHIMGTPAYIAPEQGDGRPSDHRADVYSLGATLYAMLVGQMPYTGESAIAIVMQHITAPVPDPRVKNASISEGASKIVMKMMQKKPEERYQDFDSLIHDIDVVLGIAKDGDRLIAEGAMSFDEQVTLMGAGFKSSGSAETLMEVSSPTPHTIDAKLIKSTAMGGLATATADMAPPKSRTGLYVGLIAVVILLAAGGVVAAILSTGKKPGGNGSTGNEQGQSDQGKKDGDKADGTGESKSDDGTGKGETGAGSNGGQPDVPDTPVTPTRPKIDVTILIPATGSFHSSADITVKGKCGAEARKLTINDSPAAMGQDGSFIEKLKLPEGVSEIKVAAEGDKSAYGEAVVAVTVDTRPPALSIKDFTPGTARRVNSSPLVISGTVTDLSPVQVTVDGRSVALEGENFSAEARLEEGLNRIQVMVEDQAKNRVSESLRVIYDPVPPAITLPDVPARIVRNDPMLEITGKVSEALEKFTFQGSAVEVNGRDFAVSAAMSPGQNVFVFVARDQAGNERNAEIRVEFVPIPAGLEPGLTEGTLVCLKDGAEMLPMPGGEYTMGTDSGDPDSSPPHKVSLAPFYIDRKEVTNAQYRAFLDALKKAPDAKAFSHPDEPAGKDRTPAYFDDPDFDAPDLPVVGVDWFDAYAYAKWAGKDLPTEAQWEAAAAGFAQSAPKFPWGTEEPDATRVNFDDVEGVTRPVGSFLAGATGTGLMDMAGNVQEWCLDWYDRDFYSRPEASSANPVNAAPAKYKVMRGGHFQSPAEKIRITSRAFFYPTGRYQTIGFRCVLNP